MKLTEVVVLVTLPIKDSGFSRGVREPIITGHCSSLLWPVGTHPTGMLSCLKKIAENCMKIKEIGPRASPVSHPPPPRFAKASPRCVR